MGSGREPGSTEQSPRVTFKRSRACGWPQSYGIVLSDELWTSNRRRPPPQGRPVLVFGKCESGGEAQLLIASSLHRFIAHHPCQHRAPLAVAVAEPVSIVQSANPLERPLSEFVLPVLCAGVAEVHSASQRLDRVGSAEVAFEKRTIAAGLRGVDLREGQSRSRGTKLGEGLWWASAWSVVLHREFEFSPPRNRVRRFQACHVQQMPSLRKVAASSARPARRAARFDLASDVGVD